MSGCGNPKPDESKFVSAVAVEAATLTMITTPDNPAPTPNPSPDAQTCTECKGKGRVKTGDGISWTECDVCEGTGKVTTLGQVKEYTHLPFRPVVYTTEQYFENTARDSFQAEPELQKVPYTIEDEKVSLEVALAPECTSGSCNSPSHILKPIVRHNSNRWHLGHRFEGRPIKRAWGNRVQLFRGGCGLGGC